MFYSNSHDQRKQRTEDVFAASSRSYAVTEPKRNVVGAERIDNRQMSQKKVRFCCYTIRPFSTTPCKIARDEHKCRLGRVWSVTKIPQGREVVRTGMVLALYQDDLENGLDESKWRTLRNLALVLRLCLFSQFYICKGARHLIRKISFWWRNGGERVICC